MWDNLTTAPTNVGTYRVYAVFAGSQDYSEAASDYTATQFTITPATAIVSVTAIPGLVYNGYAQDIASCSAAGVNGLLPSSDFTPTLCGGTGTFTRDWTFTDPNYVTQSGQVTDNIAPAPLTISATYSTKIYDGTTIVTDNMVPTVTGLLGTDTVTDVTVAFVSPNAGPTQTTITHMTFDTWSFVSPISSSWTAGEIIMLLGNYDAAV